MRKEMLSDDAIDEMDFVDAGENYDELGFISSSKNTRRNVRRNIEDMLEARELQRSIREVFDDDYS